MSPRTFTASTAGIWLLIGFGLAIGPDQWRSASSYDVITFGRMVPLRLWGTVFVVVGSTMIVGLYRSHPRWPLIAGVAIATAWSVSFIVAALPHVGKLTSAGAPWLWLFVALGQLFQLGIPPEFYRRRRRP